MNSQSNIGLKFLNNFDNLKVIATVAADDDFHKKFLFQDKVSKEIYGVKVIPGKNDENSSIIYVHQIKEEEPHISDSTVDQEKINNKSEYTEFPISNKNNSKCDKNKFDYIKGHEFEGIFNFLNNKNHGLANFTELISISSNGDERNNAFDVINKSFDDYFYPHPNENSFIKFDFKNHKVSLNSYSLRSKNVFFTKLVNWEIEGSNNDINWEKIDERHIIEWNDTDYTANYTVNNHKFYKYVQIRLRGPASNNDYLLALTQIEFFGELK